MFVLLKVWYEGDGNMVDDSFVAAGETVDVLLTRGRDDGALVYLPGQEVPNDGDYWDTRLRYRIAPTHLFKDD
jgi:hypothetical protein